MSIHFLPVELLQLIFRTVRDDAITVDEEDMSWMSLSCVCRTWRDILQGDPFLWTRLAFNRKASIEDIEAALDRSQGHGVDLTLSAGSSPSGHGRDWVEMLGLGYYKLRENVRFLSFRWHEDVQDTVFIGLETLVADGVVSLDLEEYCDTNNLEGKGREILSDSSSAHDNVLSGDGTEAEPEFESEPESRNADDEEDLDSDDDDVSSDEDTDSEGSDSSAGGDWDGSESDYASSEDESSEASIPDAMFGLGNDSSTYFDSESGGDKHLSELDSDEDDQATDSQAEDDDVDREDRGEDASDVDEAGSGQAEGEGDAHAVQVVMAPSRPRPPQTLCLPNLPSLINLTASSVLLSIPLEVKNRLTDLTLMDTSWLAADFSEAEVTQTWMLDVLKGCVQLEHLRLCDTLGVDGPRPAEQTVALPSLKFLSVEEVEGGVQDTLPFICTNPEILTRIKLHTVFGSPDDWDSGIDGAFVGNLPGNPGNIFVNPGNLPANLQNPHFKDTTALGLQFSDQVVALQGQMWAAGHDPKESEPRQWEMHAICSDEWSRDDRKRLLPYAILELSNSRIVAAANISNLAIHIAPYFSGLHKTHWPAVISSLPNVRTFALGSDEVVTAFLAATLYDRRLSDWPALAELHFCIASFGRGVGTNVAKLCWQVWKSQRTPRLDLKMFLRLPAVCDARGGAPNAFPRLDTDVGLKELFGEFSERIHIVAATCETCHQPKEDVDAVYERRRSVGLFSLDGDF